MYKKIYIQNIVLRHTQQYHSGPLTTNPTYVGLTDYLSDSFYFSCAQIHMFSCLLHCG